MNILKMGLIAGFAALLPSLAMAQATIPNYEFSSVAIDYPVGAGNPTYSLQGTLGQTFATVDPPTNVGQTLAYAGFQETYVPFAYIVNVSLEGFGGSANPGVPYGMGVNIPFYAETYDSATPNLVADAPVQPFYADATGNVKVLSTLNPAFAGAISLKAPLWLRAQSAITQPSNPITDYPTATLMLPAGDANNDNSVDSTDFGILIGSFNTSVTSVGSGYDPTADLNQDGSVDSTDFGLLIGEFNSKGVN
jgi:hypothetical protein